MKKLEPPYKKLVLVCVNDRDNGLESCAQKNSLEFFQALKKSVREADSEIRVTRTGCLGNCLSGASVVIQPDNIWLGEATMNDVQSITDLIVK